MSYHTIDEERGARRAEELRRRFRHVSDASFGRSRYGFGPSTHSRSRSEAAIRYAQIRNVLFWSLLAVAMVFVGSIVL
ncbi:hypothetical protein [Roseibium sp.]|uniref:hypothetical protein n=1 Tax=Roseibium sp. TaxID=1936156 RepID=UPI003D0FE56D